MAMNQLMGGGGHSNKQSNPLLNLAGQFIGEQVQIGEVQGEPSIRGPDAAASFQQARLGVGVLTNANDGRIALSDLIELRQGALSRVLFGAHE